MGSVNDVSSHYAPDLSEKTKTTVIEGIQSSDVANIMQSIARFAERRMEMEYKELQSLRDERRDLRRDMMKFAGDNGDRGMNIRRNDQSFLRDMQQDSTRRLESGNYRDVQSQRNDQDFFSRMMSEAWRNTIDNKRVDNDFTLAQSKIS